MRRVLVATLLVLVPGAAWAQDAAPPEAPTEAPVAPPSPEETEAGLREQAGRLAMQRGDLEGACADFARAFALAPTVDRGWTLADAQGALGEANALEATLRALLELAPEHARAAEARARLTVLETRHAPAVDEAAPPPDEPPEDVPAPPAAPAEEEEHDLLDEPWLWVIFAVAAVGGIVTALVLTGDPGVEDPIPGTAGEVDGIVYTLVAF